jgi:hypothetical protein
MINYSKGNLSKDFFLFPEKETKSVVLLRRRQPYTQNSAKPTQGVWGLAPKKNN